MNKEEPNDILAGMAQLEAFAKTNQYRKVGTLEGYGVLYRTLGKPTLKLIGKVLGRLLRKLALPAAAGFGMWYWLDSVWAGVIAAVVAVMFMVDMRSSGGGEDDDDEFHDPLYYRLGKLHGQMVRNRPYIDD